MQVANSARLILRLLQVEDAQSMYDLNADPAVIRYTGDPPFESVEAAKAFLQSYDHYEQHGFGRWAVIRKEDEAFVGWAGLKYNEENQVDVGFRFFQAEWGKGYATESALAAIQLGFERFQIPFIVGRTAPENTASQRVLEKIGMQYWKTGTCGHWEHALYYRMDSSSYPHSKGK